MAYPRMLWRRQGTAWCLFCGIPWPLKLWAGCFQPGMLSPSLLQTQMPVQAATTGLWLLNLETIRNPSAPEGVQTMDTNIMSGLKWSVDRCLTQGVRELPTCHQCSESGHRDTLLWLLLKHSWSCLTSHGQWFMPLAAQFPRGFLWPPSVIFQVPEEELLAVIPRSPSCCNWKAHENLQSSELMAALEAASWDCLPSRQRFLSWPLCFLGQSLEKDVPGSSGQFYSLHP